MKKPKPTKSNLKPKELKALRDINKDTSITVLPAYKGNATVVMNTEDYKNKIKEFLDPGTYHTPRKDPTKSILRKTKAMAKSSSLDEETRKKVCRSEALTPRLYGLPKIHKHNVPLRPIVSTIGSPTYDSAKHLTTLLQPPSSVVTAIRWKNRHVYKGLGAFHFEDQRHTTGSIRYTGQFRRCVIIHQSSIKRSHRTHKEDISRRLKKSF
nr:unnamed protein product [Callosobruchus analis]